MQYYEKLKELRENHRETQEDIAKLLGTERSYYAKYEAGKRPLPMDRLYILCKHYHVSADYIMGLPRGLPYGQSELEEKE